MYVPKTIFMEKIQPTLHGEAIYLRPFTMADADLVTHYCSHEAMHQNTSNIPKNYTIDVANWWLSKLPDEFQQNKSAVFAITEKTSDLLVGAIGLHFQQSHNKAEMGYWVGNPFWGKGYCSQAAQTIIRYGFEQLYLNKIYAHHMAHNPASGRVMQKAGMEYEGYLKEHLLRDGMYIDVVCYGITKKNWKLLHSPQNNNDDLIANR